MAALNVTQAGVTTAVQEFDAALSAAVHHEKISSPLSSFSEKALLELRGKRVDVIQGFGDRLSECRFSARVLGVFLPALGSDVGTSLLLLEDGYSDEMMDSFDASDLRLVVVE
ncbi:TPA: hypothetical protein ACIDY2_006341 [Pseudomonas aeruginosa]|nr:hypothetical protein [Pseudomonas aeruginosa]